MIATKAVRQSTRSIKHGTSRMIQHCRTFNAVLDNATTIHPDRIPALRRMAAQELRAARGKCYWGNRSMLAVLLQTATIAVLYR